MRGLRGIPCADVRRWGSSPGGPEARRRRDPQCGGDPAGTQPVARLAQFLGHGPHGVFGDRRDDGHGQDADAYAGGKNEELVGEIHDETDIEEVEISPVGEDSAICLAAVDLRDLEGALDITFPDSEHRSLNGFILEELGHVPTRGETLEVDGIRIEVLTASETQVLRARVSKIAGKR